MGSDGTIIWEPELQTKCEYVQWKTIEGDLSKDIWVSRDRELALTFKAMTKVQDCNSTFIVSDQGYAILSYQFEETKLSNNSRSKREAPGIVLSNQLAGQLTAGQENALKVTKEYFKSALYHICQNSDTLADAIKSLASANPTLLARQLLENPNIQARLITESLLEVTPCEELNMTQVHFTPLQHCFDKMPVKFEYYDNTLTLHGFMDPVTGVVSSKATEVDCNTHSHFYIEQSDGKIKQINQKTGHVEYVKEAEKLNFKSAKLQYIKDEHRYLKILSSQT
uniref:Uncharacterized protein n=1 Tax=Panagrolaimus superbus TaxID=310955 RepID=A0A914Y6W6_9BILA